MSQDMPDIKLALGALQEEVRLLKENFQSLNSKYTENLIALKQLTLTSSEAATRAANAGQPARQAPARRRRGSAAARSSG